MKNFIYIILLFVSTQIIGQQDAPCSFESPPNFFENGLRSSSEDTQVVANDLIVSSGDEFTLDYIEVQFFSTPLLVDADISYYEDDNGLPGNVLNSMTDVTPTSLNYIGSFGLDSWEIIFEVPPFAFTSQEGEATRYWISITMSNFDGDSAVFWETKSIEQQGLQPAIFDGSSWMLVDTSGGQHLEGVYIFSGECLLNTSEKVAPSILLYPNPVTETLKCFNCEEVTEAVVYNLSGQRISIYDNFSEELNVQFLQTGMYFVELSGPDFKRTFRIIKE